jgi:acetoin utilization protein AcuC
MALLSLPRYSVNWEIHLNAFTGKTAKDYKYIIEADRLTQENVQRKGSIFVYSDEMAAFDFGPDHPFKPERASKTYELCNRYGVINHPWIKILKPEPIEKGLLTLFHDPRYLSLLEKASQGEVLLEMIERGIGTPDNPILSGIYEWSLKGAGGTQAAMDLLVSGNAIIAFNPLGGFHHAGSGRAEGFCYINDIVIAIKDAITKFPQVKVAYIDLDAHHGNGVQEAFYNDPRVLFIRGRVLRRKPEKRTEKVLP